MCLNIYSSHRLEPIHSANKQTETIHWRGTKHPVPESRRKTCIYLFHFFIIRLFRVCCWNSSDNSLRLHKSNSVESQYEAGYTKNSQRISSLITSDLKHPSVEFIFVYWISYYVSEFPTSTKQAGIWKLKHTWIYMGYDSLEHLKCKRNQMPSKYTQTTYNTLSLKTSHSTSNKKFGQQASYKSNAYCLHKRLLLTRKWLLMRTCSFLASGLKRPRS